MVNFQRLITKLIRTHGWTETEIARYCGVSQANISRLKLTKGAEPKHSTGEKLIKLLAKQ